MHIYWVYALFGVDLVLSYVEGTENFLKYQIFREELEVTKGVIIIRISKKNRQYNGQNKKYTYKTKDRVTRTPLKTGGEHMCSGRVGSSCSTSDTRRVNLVANPVVSHERGKDREVLMISGSYPWSFVTHIFHNGQTSHGGDRKAFEGMTST